MQVTRGTMGCECPVSAQHRCVVTSISRSKRPSFRSWIVARIFCFSSLAASCPTKLSRAALFLSRVAACSSSTFRVISEMSSSVAVLSCSAYDIVQLPTHHKINGPLYRTIYLLLMHWVSKQNYSSSTES